MSLRFPAGYAHLAARLRVPLGFLLAIAFGWLSRPSMLSLTIGFPVAIMGLLLRGWAAGHLEKNIRLATAGPYAWVRNPLYLGTVLAAAGLAIASRRPALILLFALAFVLVYLPAVQREEEYLRELFPAFAEYSRTVPGFLPRRPVKTAAGDFRMDLYWRNEEYRALLGFLAGAAWLIAKLFWM
jgi:protein-S-isoprenylcysteine O-methyltransferase Ste14